MEEKAMVASQLIAPSNLVGYLIVDDMKDKKDKKDGGDWMWSLWEPEDEEEPKDDARLVQQVPRSAIMLEQIIIGDDEAPPVVQEGEETEQILYTTELGDDTTALVVETDDAAVSDDETVELQPTKFVQKTKSNWVLGIGSSMEKEEEMEVDHRLLKRQSVDNAITVAILHVSSHSGYELLDMLLKETKDIREEGGMKIVLNSKEPPATFKTIFIWALLGFVVSGSCCLCALALTNPEQENAAPQRPAPRRLTNAQVREKFPAFHYDPERFVEQPLDDECVICLDDFEEGMRIRQLPCGHVFHSTCIARWLIERSATCPLCKADFYEEVVADDEEEEAESPARATPPPTTVTRLVRWMSTMTELSEPQEASGPEAANMPAAPPAQAFRWPFASAPSGGTSEGDAVGDGTTGASPRSWRSRSWFGRRARRRSTGEGLQTELTEPLLTSASNEASVTASPTSGVEDENNSSSFTPPSETSQNHSEVPSGADEPVPSAGGAPDRVESTTSLSSTEEAV